MTSPKTGLRQRLFGRSKSRADSAAAPLLHPGSGVTEQLSKHLPHRSVLRPTPTRLGHGQKPSNIVLEDALELLDAPQRTEIAKYTVGSSDRPDVAIENAYKAAVEKRRLCEDKQWKWTIHGRVVNLRDVADRVVLWIDKFKAAGDIASNADPIHVGLPWAGIRLLLEVLVSESRQMAVLLTGIESALFMASRVSVYHDYYNVVPDSPARKNLRQTLTQYYACILGFLADAIQILGRDQINRTLEAFMNDSTCRDFEMKCNKLAQRTAVDASNCDRAFDAHDRQLAERASKQLQQSLQGLQDVLSSLDSLNVKIDLDKLAIAEEAGFDSYAERHNATCLENTRRDLLRDIDQWVDSPDSKTIFWLSGMAGTGKSTVARTVAKKFSANTRQDSSSVLGASFFFKRGEGDQGNARKFFTTLAAQLAYRVPTLHRSIAQALDENPELSRKPLEQQFEALILNPLSKVDVGIFGCASLLLIIDGLDECEDDDDVQSILQQLEAVHVQIRLRIFVTSRPELPIRLGFAAMRPSSYQNIVLHEVSPATIEHDITVYLKHEFAAIRAVRSARQPQHPLPEDWPGEDQIQALVTMANPLFIYAATMCRFISDKKGDPVARLSRVLQQTSVLNSKLDQTYLPILSQIFDDENDHNDEIKTFKQLVGPLVLLAKPLSTKSISQLMRAQQDAVAWHLDLFHSVLNVPEDENAPVRILHLSFRDFLVSRKQAEKTHRFAIDEEETHKLLAMRCLHLLSQPGRLKRNICALTELDISRSEVSQATIADKISDEVAYACLYWVHHVQQSKQSLTSGDAVHVFLERHFLHWIEALSWLGMLSQAMMLIHILASLSETTKHDELANFLADSRRFLAQSFYIVDHAPLQLYASALVFAPGSSIVKNVFKSSLMIPLNYWPQVLENWSPERLRLQGHVGPVLGVVFSSDGKLIASASLDRTVRIWRVSTGLNTMTLRSHDRTVSCVAFSSDDSLLASGSLDGHVRVWSVKTGEQITKLKVSALLSPVLSVSFASDRQWLLSVAEDEEVKRWRIETKEGPLSPQASVLGFTSYNVQISKTYRPVVAAAFSSSGQLLAMVGSDNRVRLYELSTGKVKLSLENGNTDPVTAITFLPNDRLVASGSWDKSMRIWQVADGVVLLEADGYGDNVKCAAYSPDGSLTALGMLDWTIDTWEIASDDKQPPIDEEEQNAESISLAALVEGDFEGLSISPDGVSLAGTCFDGSVRVWNTGTNEEVGAWRRMMNDDQKHDHPDDTDFAHDDGPISQLVFSPDGKSMLEMSRRTVRLLQVSSGQVLQEHQIERAKYAPFLATSPMGYLSSRESRSALDSIITHRRSNSQDFRDVTFSPDGEMFAAKTGSSVWVRKTSDSKIVHELFPRQPDGWFAHVQKLTFSPDSKFIAFASETTVEVWSVTSGASIWKRLHMHNLFGVVCFCPSSSMVALVNDFNNVIILDIATGEQQGKGFKCGSGALGTVSAAAFSPDETLLASAAVDHCVTLWHVANGSQLCKLYGSPRLTHNWNINLPGVEAYQQKARGHVIHDMVFSADAQSVQTNIGRIELPANLTSPAERTRAQPLTWTGISGSWIQYRGHNVIWLPNRFRGRRVVSHDNTIAVFQAWGLVTVFSFKQDRAWKPPTLLQHDPVQGTGADSERSGLDDEAEKADVITLDAGSHD